MHPKRPHNNKSGTDGTGFGGMRAHSVEEALFDSLGCAVEIDRQIEGNAPFHSGLVGSCCRSPLFLRITSAVFPFRQYIQHQSAGDSS